MRSHIRDDLIGASVAGCAVIVFCFILLWHNPLVFWNDDYELSVLPVFADMARSWSEGHWPILSPYSWVCGNLAGEFQYGTFSVFVNAAVILIWKFPLTFPQQAASVSIAHLIVLAVGAYLLARDRGFCDSAIGVRCSDRVTQRLDHLLGRGRLVRRARRVHLAAMGMVGSRTRARFATDEMAVHLAGAVRLSARHGRISLHGFDAAASNRLAVNQVVSQNPEHYLDSSDVLWRSARFRPFRASMACAPRSGSGFSAGVAIGSGTLAVARSACGTSRIDSAIVDSELDGFFLAQSTACCDRTSLRLSRSYGTYCRISLASANAYRSNQMGAHLAFNCALGLHDTNSRSVSVEFSVVAVFPSGSGDLCGGGFAPKAGVTDPGFSGPCARRFDRLGSIDLSDGGSYATPLSWILFGLAAVWFCLEFLLHNSEFRQWLPVAITFCAFLATYVCIPTNYGVPRYNFSQELLKPAPLDPQRLYLSVYPWAELTYCMANKPQPVGQTLRPGSTSMWAGLRFINGYSPIRAAGVAREFETTIHGEINPDVGSYLLSHQAGKGGELELMGVDGIVVAREVNMLPQPDTEWEMVVSTNEGNIFHRRSPPFARVRSIIAMDSRPNEQFVSATISRIHDSPDFVEADIDVPTGNRPALLTFSRPYFRGYKARLDNKKLAVTTYRGLFPTVEIPAGAHGRLTLIYRPSWLVWGGSLAAGCGLIVLLGLIAASRYYSSTARESGV